MDLRGYECSLDGEHWSPVCATSRGKAKSSFLLDLDMDGFEFTDVRCRVTGPPATPSEFTRVAKGRGVPYARVGMAVEVGGQRGRIVGYNSSCNFDVLFEPESRWGEQVLNCHPNYNITYYDEDGAALGSFPGRLARGEV
jgi:hypothetical protein